MFGKTVLLYSLFLMVEWVQRDKQHALQFTNTMPFNYRIVRWVIYLLIIGMSYLAYMERFYDNSPFIYFQF